MPTTMQERFAQLVRGLSRLAKMHCNHHQFLKVLYGERTDFGQKTLVEMLSQSDIIKDPKTFFAKIIEAAWNSQSLLERVRLITAAIDIIDSIRSNRSRTKQKYHRWMVEYLMLLIEKSLPEDGLPKKALRQAWEVEHYRSLKNLCELFYDYLESKIECEFTTEHIKKIFLWIAMLIKTRSLAIFGYDNEDKPRLIYSHRLISEIQKGPVEVLKNVIWLVSLKLAKQLSAGEYMKLLQTVKNMEYEQILRLFLSATALSSPIPPVGRAAVLSSIPNPQAATTR